MLEMIGESGMNNNNVCTAKKKRTKLYMYHLESILPEDIKTASTNIQAITSTYILQHLYNLHGGDVLVRITVHDCI